MVVAALLVDLVFSAAGLIPDTRPSIDSITDRGVSLNYTAVLNVVFTVVGAALIFLTVRRGTTDPVCGMTVDRHRAPHSARFAGRVVHFCSAGCHAAFQEEPERYAPHAPH
jgi:YHS domain-containing protein